MQEYLNQHICAVRNPGRDGQTNQETQAMQNAQSPTLNAQAAKRWRSLIALVAAMLFLAVAGVTAAPIFTESFNYGGTTSTIQSVSDFTTSSGVLYYDHDGNLEHPLVTGTAGGSFWENFGSAGGRSAVTTRPEPDYNLSGMAAGDTVWYAALIQYNNLDSAFIQFTGTGKSTVTFGFDASGNVVVTTFDVSNLDTGKDATADGSTYLLVLRATRGTTTPIPSIYPPYDSQIDFWFNPMAPLAKDATDLGLPDWTSGATSRWGSYTDPSFTFSGITIDSGYGNRIDEIRVGHALSDLGFATIPEPASLGLLALGGLALLRRRR